MSELLPVFPLNVPLLPGCSIPLQIFERRYTDMVANCLTNNTDFAVALLMTGEERHEVYTQTTPKNNNDIPFYRVGTVAKIVDFGSRENGLLAITIKGMQKCYLKNIYQASSGLWMATTDTLLDSGDLNTALSQSHLSLLKNIVKLDEMERMGIILDTISSEHAMNFLITLLPFSAETKQMLIETSNLQLRQQKLAELIDELQSAKVMHIN